MTWVSAPGTRNSSDPERQPAGGVTQEVADHPPGCPGQPPVPVQDGVGSGAGPGGAHEHHGPHQTLDTCAACRDGPRGPPRQPRLPHQPGSLLSTHHGGLRAAPGARKGRRQGPRRPSQGVRVVLCGVILFYFFTCFPFFFPKCPESALPSLCPFRHGLQSLPAPSREPPWGRGGEDPPAVPFSSIPEGARGAVTARRGGTPPTRTPGGPGPHGTARRATDL